MRRTFRGSGERETKMRHAKYRRSGRTWIALGTALEGGDDTAGRAVGAARDLAYPLPLEED